jgi:hypothetical protein
MPPLSALNIPFSNFEIQLISRETQEERGNSEAWPATLAEAYTATLVVRVIVIQARFIVRALYH